MAPLKEVDFLFCKDLDQRRTCIFCVLNMQNLCVILSAFVWMVENPDCLSNKMENV